MDIYPEFADQVLQVSESIWNLYSLFQNAVIHNFNQSILYDVIIVYDNVF